MAPLWKTGGDLLAGDFERQATIWTTPALTASENYVKEGSGKVKLSPKRPRRENGGGSFTGDFETQIKVGFGHGVSLSTGDLREEPGGRAILLGTPTVTSRKALEMEQLPLYRGSVRGTWMDCCTEDSDIHVTEGSGNGAFHL